MPEQPKETGQNTKKPEADSAAAQTESSKPEEKAAAAKAALKRKGSGKKISFGLPLFTAGLGGGIIALAAGAVLLNSGLRPPKNSAALPAARAQTEQVLEALPDKSASAAQFKAELAEKRQAQAEKTQRVFQAQPEQIIAAAPQAEADFAALQKRLQALADKQNAQAEAIKAHDRALSALQEQLTAAAGQNREILAKTDALREEAALIYAGRQNGQKQIAALAALQSFQNAFDSGASYAAQLQVFNAAFPHIWQETAGDKAPAIKTALQHWQETGLPDKAALAAGFVPLADRLAAAANSADENANAGFWQKIAHGLSPWLRIRPQGEAQGDSPAAVLARLEAALTQGADKPALAEALKLPPSMQSEVNAYLAPLALRQSAHETFAAAAQSVFPPAQPAPESGAGRAKN